MHWAQDPTRTFKSKIHHSFRLREGDTIDASKNCHIWTDPSFKITRVWNSKYHWAWMGRAHVQLKGSDGPSPLTSGVWLFSFFL